MLMLERSVRSSLDLVNEIYHPAVEENVVENARNEMLDKQAVCNIWDSERVFTKMHLSPLIQLFYF